MTPVWNDIFASDEQLKAPQGVDILHESVLRSSFRPDNLTTQQIVERISEYYISKTFQRTLAGVTVPQSKFKRELNEFLTADRTKFSIEQNNAFAGLAYRIVEFYQNDTKIDEIVQSGFAEFLPPFIAP